MKLKTFEKLFYWGSFVLILFTFWLGGYVAQTVFHASNVVAWGSGACAAIIPIVFCALFGALLQNGIDSETDDIVVRKTPLEDWKERVNSDWVAHAYPLQQIVVQVQGTKHSDREDMINQLKEVISRLESGDETGESHDDDYGYRFNVTSTANTSFFDEAAAVK